MLKLLIPSTELFDESNNQFIDIKEQTLCLEHSLVSISKWESKWCIPFITNKDKTEEQIISYIECMSLNPNVDPIVYRCLNQDHMKQIQEYISSPMTATTINDRAKSPSKREILTSEVIYYQMIAFSVPFECQKWHINRLLTLLRICSIKNSTPNKMSKSEVAKMNRNLNAQRKARLNTTG